MDIDIIPEPDALDREYDKEQEANQENWRHLLAWPPAKMLAESLEAELQTPPG